MVTGALAGKQQADGRADELYFGLGEGMQGGAD
jgi:hypothetical protein